MRFPRIAVLFSSIALAAIASAEDVEGFLVDKACSARIVKEGQKVAATHNKECALMDGCHQSGFGVYTADGKYVPFDKAGNKKAEDMLNKATKSDNLKVRVSGKMQGASLKVDSITLL